MEANSTLETVGVDIQKESSTSRLIGYVVVLAAMFVAFEWTQRDIKVEETDKIYDFAPVEEDMIPITRQEQPMQAPPPAAAPLTPEILDVVDNKEELPDQEIQTTEEVNQAITTTTGTGAPTAVVQGPPAPVVEEVEDETIHDVPEVQASFPGDVYQWIKQNMKYPAAAQEQGIQGRVSIQFVVNKDGSIVDVKVQRSPDQSLSDEAERLVKKMPKWTPARMGGKPVRSRFSLPITFRLQ